MANRFYKLDFNVVSRITLVEATGTSTVGRGLYGKSAVTERCDSRPVYTSETPLQTTSQDTDITTNKTFSLTEADQVSWHQIIKNKKSPRRTWTQKIKTVPITDLDSYDRWSNTKTKCQSLAKLRSILPIVILNLQQSQTVTR